MKTAIAFLIPALVLAAAAPLEAHAAPAAQAPSPAAADPAADAEANDVLNRACTACHDRTVIANARRPAEEWPGLVERMRSLGAIISDPEAAEVAAYLAAHNSAAH